MMHKALIVEDNPICLENYFDALDSLNHKYDVADCQQTARELLAGNEYSYVLLDMSIPVKPGRMSRQENGENLLGEIVKGGGPPVIITTGQGLGDNAWTADLLAAGAANFINKDFPRSGRTLDSLIKKLLKKPSARQRLPPGSEKRRQFTGGTMVFYPDRVELSGVIVSSGMNQVRRILELLCAKRATGRYVTYRGDALAEMLGSLRGQNAVAETIHNFRRQAAVCLGEAGIDSGPEDVIRSGGPGYRFNEWIEVQTAELPCPLDVDDPIGRRRQGILDELKKGRELRATDIEAEFRCSNSTAKRDITALRRAGYRIKFQGPGRTGHYCLADG